MAYIISFVLALAGGILGVVAGSRIGRGLFRVQEGPTERAACLIMLFLGLVGSGVGMSLGMWVTGVGR